MTKNPRRGRRPPGPPRWRPSPTSGRAPPPPPPVGPGAAPAAGHLLDGLGEHLFVLDAELAADRIVMEGAGAPRDGDVEACEVAARCAAVARGHGPRTLGQRCPRVRRMEPRL